MRAGFGSAEITAYERGMGMLGWGQPDNVALHVAEPLHARAMAVEDRDGARIAYVCLDLCFVSSALRQGVLDRLAPSLGLDPHRVMLTATHTHSGPSGFSHAFLYDLSGPGFAPRVFARLVEGTLEAIGEAVGRLEPARLSLGRVTVPCAEPVAFNRALRAFHANRELQGHAAAADRALDRTLTLVAAHDARGRALGALSFFALHATSVHGDRQAIHSDHKGLAARALERWARANGGSDRFVALCAQGAAGDVTPNYRFDARRGVTVGRYDDDHDSAAYVGEVLARAAASVLVELPARGEPLEGPVGGAVVHEDFEALMPARLGVGMAMGTREGPGPLAPIAPLVRLSHRARAERDDPKAVLLEVGRHRRARLFGAIDPLALPLAHPVFAHARRARERGGGVDALPWIPSVLPVAILRLGPLAILGLPNEPTTMAGARLRRALAPALAPLGVTALLPQGYANAYAGYLTTPEEYALQGYEGAYTLFGPRSLEAFERSLRRAARRLVDDEALGPPTPALELCTEAQLEARRSPLASGASSAWPAPRSS